MMKTSYWIVILFLVFKQNEGELTKPVIQANNLPIVEYTQTRFTCSSKFQPVPVNISSEEITYTWFLNGVKVTQGAKLNVYSPKLNRKQTGTALTCSASDVLGNKSPISAALKFDVQYKPGKPVFKPEADVYVLGNNCTNTVGPIVCYSDCNPRCSYRWKLDNSRLNGATFPLTILARATRDQTQLFCISFNRHGNFTRHITIRFVPEAPRDFYCTERTEDSVLLVGKSTNKNVQIEVSKGKFSDVSDSFSDVSDSFSDVSDSFSNWSAFILHLEHEGNTFKANVSGLTEGTNFLFRVFAQNPSGRSDLAATVCQTRSAPLQSGQMAGSSGLSFPVGIAVGVSIIVLLIIIALLIAALYFKTSVAGKRKAEGLKALFFQSANKSSERKGPEGIETQDSVTPGTQYETLGPTQPQTPVTYEKLQLYENQDFQKKSGKKPVNQDNIYVNDVDLNAMP